MDRYRREHGVDRFMAHRPLAMFGLLYAMGALVGYYGHMGEMIWLAMAAFALLCLALFRRRVFLFALALMLGGLIAAHASVVPAAIPMDDVAVAGRILTEPDDNGLRSAFMLTDVRIDGDPFPHDVRAYIYRGELNARVGDRIAFPADTWLPRARSNPHGFDFRAWMWTRGATLGATGNADEALISRPEGFDIWALIGASRAWLSDRISARFPHNAPLMKALLLGDRSGLDDGIQDSFRLSGMAHLLAVSGLHIACLALVIEKLLQWLGLSRRVAIYASVVVLLCYAALIGFPASVLRALLMFISVRGAFLSGRPNDPLTSLVAAAMALLIFNPLYIADVGFQFSFGVVLGILLLSEPVTACFRLGKAAQFDRRDKQPLWRVLHNIRDTLAIGIVAQLISLPIIANTFGYVSLLSPLVNLIAIPLSTAIMPLSVLNLLPGFSWFNLPDLMADMLIRLADMTARIRFNAATLPAWPVWLVALYMAMCWFASPYVRLQIKWRMSLMILLVPVALSSIPLMQMTLPHEGLQLTFVDAGQADATVVRADGRVYAVDLGNPDSPAIDYMIRTGQRPEAVFLTHPHADHCGGFAELLQLMPPKLVYIPDCWYDVEADAGINEQLEIAQSMGIEIRKLATGDLIPLSDEIILEVLQPARGYLPKDGNGASLVILIRYGDGTALLTGDLPIADELGHYPDIDLMKAAHHGSNNSNSEKMLLSAAPSALIFTTKQNSSTHPGARVLEAADRHGIQTFRTDRDGAITADIQRDGHIHIETFLQEGAS